MIRTQIQLTDEQSAALKKLASQKNESMAEMIRQGVKILLHSVSCASLEERRRRAIAIAGCFHSGLSDLSKKHDKYLNEKYLK